MDSIDKVPEYDIQPGLKDGTKTKGEILDIQDGAAEDFVKNADAWQGDIKAPAYNLVFKSLETGRVIEQILTHPTEGEKLSDRSNLAKFKDENGEYPYKGQKVTLIVKGGFERLKL